MNRRWIWRMALRDGRRGVKHLLLSMSCVILGVMSVVTAYSFRDNLQSAIQRQSKSLLGADLAIDSRQTFSESSEALIASLGGEQSRQIGFASMAYFPASGDARLVQVRAVSGNFPFYGALETEPKSAVGDFQRGSHALVDENVMLQFNARVGDRLRIGDGEFVIKGKLRKIPGETLAFSLISPRVYIPLSRLDQTQLIQKGSLVRYRVYFKLSPEMNVDAWVEKMTPELQRLGLEADTVRRRTATIALAMENLSRYLRLAVFVAVLLAGVGVASGIHVYVKDKFSTIAVLRCIGASPRETVFVYLIQTSVMTLAGSVIGALLGTALQHWVFLALKDFLPVSTVTSVATAGIGVGFAVGLGTAVLFSLIPLVPLRKISPLLALRSAYEARGQARDPWLWMICFLIVVMVGVFAVVTSGGWRNGFYFTAGVLGAFGLIVLAARGLSAAMRRFAPPLLSFPWRQGLANLHRPNNQTTAVMLAIGLGTFLLVTLYSVRSFLVDQAEERAGVGEPNLVLFDVQRDQRRNIGELLKSFDVTLYDEVPVVTMRLAAVKGRRVEELRSDPASAVPRWALRREYRSTYRSHLSGTEKMIEGVWQGKVNGPLDSIPVSLEKGIAQTLGVKLGDPLLFEVQGVPLLTRVANLREVEWDRVRPNFFVVFPEGVLEEAPQFYAVAARAGSPEASANFQRALVNRFPNVSAIDLTLILNTLNSVLAKVTQAVRFIALFAILTGLAVLGSAVLSSRGQRIKELILLRTLGADRRQVIISVVAEYCFLGALAALTGALLAVVASWALGLYFFKVWTAIAPAPIAVIVVLVSGLTIIAGVSGCWGIFRRSALEALRAET